MTESDKAIVGALNDIAVKLDAIVTILQRSGSDEARPHQKTADVRSAKASEDFYLALTKAGQRGLTEHEMKRQSPFRSYSMVDRQSILHGLIKKELVVFLPMKTAGRTRRAYVAIPPQEEER